MMVKVVPSVLFSVSTITPPQMTICPLKLSGSKATWLRLMSSLARALTWGEMAWVHPRKHRATAGAKNVQYLWNFILIFPPQSPSGPFP